ncbi:MAG: hypothetical protein Q8916_14220 [Bacteroidota bacterium]|nr:hypothetical protein [Bacteroidota bacterium]MDP4231550.1 hypothetical protein [Bacteroidota bacterium]MDP4237321.1 hypothetical protein [Bacteroidota bacterium]
MAEDNKFTSPEAHKFLGIEFNMKVWDLLGKANRTDEEDQAMIHAAHASHCHWSYVGTSVHTTRGEWLISHVYAVLGRAEPALYHSKRCLQVCLDHHIADFDLAYGYESMARALAADGNLPEAGRYYSLAKEAGEAIKDPDAKKFFVGDFGTGPWYGLEQ